MCTCALAPHQRVDLTCDRLILFFASLAAMEDTASQFSSSLAPAMVARLLRPVPAVFASFAACGKLAEALMFRLQQS